MNRFTFAALLFLSTASHAPTAHAGTPAEDLRMASDSQPFRDTADRFVARAVAGDVDAAAAMLSRELVARTGEATIRRALETQIVPFFRAGGGAGGSVTVTQTTDAAGQRGYAFYMWMRQGSNVAPYTVYVVSEGDRLAVANVVPNRLVEGRHTR